MKDDGNVLNMIGKAMENIIMLLLVVAFIGGKAWLSYQFLSLFFE